jgi:fimbrial chaperone protein
VFVGHAGAAGAAALQVAPVLLDIPAPGATSTVTLRNEGPRPLNAQIRVFRWTQENGQDKLEPVTDVVASPPSASLASRTDYAVRIVRLNRAPAAREEAYRLVVDELPDASRERNGTIAVVLRHSIPVFFAPTDAETARVTWKAKIVGAKLVLQATNTGGRRLRLAAMKVSDGKTTVNFGDGLVGYSLSGTTMTWERPIPAGFSASAIRITAQSDLGPVDARAAVTR